MIIYSPYILSNAQIGLLACALFDIQLDPFRFRLHPRLKENWFKYWKTPIFWVPSLLFFIVLVGAFYSTDFRYSFERIQLKIPFLATTFAFFCLPRLSRRAYSGLFCYLVLILFLTNLGIGGHYLLNFEEINQMLELGQAIPTPRNHIRYSLLLSLGILAGIVLCYQRFYLRWKAETWLIGAFTAFNFVFIHILSVRSGLVVLYCSLFLGILLMILMQKKYLIGALLLTIVSFLPFVAYHSIPSFKSKISYASWEFHEFSQGRINKGSDHGRLLSLQVGHQIFKENPIIGVGAGDLKREVKQKYELLYPERSKQIMPHNQFLSVAAGSGIIGLLIFIFAFFYPFLSGGRYSDPFFMLILITFSLSLLVENTLENSIGIGFFCLFLGFGLSRLRKDKEAEPTQKEA